MTISEQRYVKITSGVGGAAQVPNRELVARIFTANALLPPQTFLSFTTPAQVGNYFGLGSEEYARAVFYFSWISKNLTQPPSIQFARWVNAATAPLIFPLPNNGSLLANWTSITSGSFVLTMGGVTNTLSGLNFSAAASLADVATIVEEAIEAAGSFTLTGTTNGTTLVTMASTAGLVPGMAVQATDITEGTTIVSIVPNTSITLSQVATGSNVGETITFNNALWGLTTITYSSAYGGFLLVGGATGTANIVVAVGGGGTDITGAGLLGWLPQQVLNNGTVVSMGAIWSPGSALETITQALTTSADNSNNFGSFTFLTNLGITQQEMVDAATWNQTQNVLYMYSQAVTPANVASWQAAVAAIGGIGLTVSPTISFARSGTLANNMNTVMGLTTNDGILIGMPVTATDLPAGTTVTSKVGTTGLTLSANATASTTELLTFYSLEFPEMFPMMIAAATNYAAINSVQNYEFQQVFGLTPSVTDDATADAYDMINVNYYGATQQAGQIIAFYQKGLLQGASIPTNIVDMNAYVNEIWLKDAALAAILNLLLVLPQIPANSQGRNLILAVLQSVINLALLNGTISVGKTLTTAQQMFITAATGDPLAWYQVQNSGYWVNVIIVQSGNDFIATYTLIYSKNDVIRKVVGTHTLI
jgi:hypothetical protein